MERERGLALVMTVSVVALVLVISTTSVAAVIADLADARRSTARAAAHATAEGASDELFARIVRDSHYLDGAYHNHPALAPAWATLDGGAPQACRDPYDSVCYQLTVSVGSHAAVVSVLAATLCPRGLGDIATCVTETVRQEIVQRQFFDFLYFDELETLDPVLLTGSARDDAASNCAQHAPQRPARCIPVPFLGGDTIYGPIHTNDASFTSCLSPTFEPPVSRNGWPATKTTTGDGAVLESTGSEVFTPAPSVVCQDSRPREAAGVTESAPTPHYSFAVDVSQLSSIALPADRYSGTTTIHLQSTTYNGHAWPGSGVIYVDGDVYVDGAACHAISIASTGTVYIDGDLTYGPDDSCPDAVTGLEADDAVMVLTTNGPSGPAINASRDRTIEAAVLALGKHSCAAGAPTAPGVTCGSSGAPRGGSFSVRDWNTSPTATPHTLHFLGAIASVWRGAIGAFDPSTGQLESGWAKDFAYDARLRTTQPPYFLAPVGAGWARTDLRAA